MLGQAERNRRPQIPDFFFFISKIEPLSEHPVPRDILCFVFSSKGQARQVTCLHFAKELKKVQKWHVILRMLTRIVSAFFSRDSFLVPTSSSASETGLR